MSSKPTDTGRHYTSGIARIMVLNPRKSMQRMPKYNLLSQLGSDIDTFSGSETEFQRVASPPDSAISCSIQREVKGIAGALDPGAKPKKSRKYITYSRC
ncbi:hypothetical protein Trydic_g21175 [Trypoxylus dichotomus]